MLPNPAFSPQLLFFYQLLMCLEQGYECSLNFNLCPGIDGVSAQEAFVDETVNSQDLGADAVLLAQRPGASAIGPQAIFPASWMLSRLTISAVLM